MASDDRKMPEAKTDARPAPFTVSPRKAMGMGEGMPGGEDFGAEPIRPGIPHSDAEMDSGRDMGDMDRGARPPVRGSNYHMGAQAHPDHGPHRAKKRG